MLRSRIVEGEYPVGSCLPSINQLQHDLGARAPNTIRRAQQLLVREGLLRTEQGVGVWVLSAQDRPTRTTTIETLQKARDHIDLAIAQVQSLMTDVPQDNQCTSRDDGEAYR